MPIEFDEFVSNPRFQKSTPDVKLKALDLLSDTMFKEGRLDDVERALQFRASTELQALSQAPANQFMGALSTGLLGSEADPSIAFGADYDRIQRDYQQKVSALKSEPGIIQTGPEDFYYTRKNPFGQGTLVEHGGGKSFIPQGMGDPNTIGETLRSAGLEPIKKDAIFGDTLSRANEYTKVGELLQDDSFQILPQGDQRTLLRSFANNRNAQGDVLARDEAQEMLQAMDQQWDATLRSGQFAPTDKPWYDFFTTAVDRGSSSYFQNKEIKLIKRKYELINRLQDTLTPEQKEYLDSPGVRESLIEVQSNLPGARLEDIGKPRTGLKDALVGTPLEGVSTWKLSSYLGAVESPEYKLAEAEYETRNKAMALIGNTQGMEQFTQTQAAIKERGGSGWEQAVTGIGAFAANPMDVAFNVTLQSMVSQPGALASNIALFAIPGPTQGRAAINTFNMVRGTAVGLIAGATESSFAYTNALESRRTNPDGTQKPLGEMFTDYQTMRAVNDEAMARGAAIGTISGITGYLLPGAMGQLERFYLNRAAALEAAPSLRHTLGFNATQIAAQMASEAKGEYFAEVLSGQEVNIGEIILEAGGGLGDAATMWQGTPGFAAARQALTVQQQADAAVALARAQAVDAAIVEPGAAVTENAPTQGIFARGLSPQVEIGPVDANGNADITVFVDEASMEAVPAPQATVDQGLESVTPEVARRSPSLPPLPAVPQEVEEAAQREMEALSAQAAEPIQSASALVEGQPISWLMPDGSTQSGVVADLQGSSFTVNGEPQSFTPGKYFSNEVKPKQNARKLTRGDVLFDGDTFYRYDDETYDDFAVGQKTPDGKVQFDKSERRELEEGFINDPRVKIYAKADFDRAMQDYNGRQNPLPEDRFTDILNNTPEKAEPAASPDTQAGIVEPTEPTTEPGTPQGPTVAEVNERAATPVLSNPVTSNRTVLFKLRTHKDVAGLLSKAVGRWEQWSKATKILEESPDAIVYVKDAKIQELHRNQAPETFDGTVAQLRKEDAANRDAREPQAWSEVAAYRELERYLKDRVARTQLSRNKNKRSSGILEYAQINTTIEALFIQDKAIAAYAAAKFGLYTPNASLITVEDVADLRYGNIERWVNANSFSSATGGYEAVNRTLNLGGNASVEDVFHELYHDFFENIAPLILTTGQYSKLQKLIESNLTKPAVRSFLEKRGYTLTPKKAQNRGINYEAQYQFRDGLGNISIAAHEAFTQLMTTYHFSQRNPRGVTPETRRILGVISDFFARTFQDWNKEPLPILTDDAKDLLDNFFTTPPPLRRLAFRPSIRSERIDNEAQETTEEIERINRAIRGEEEYADVPPEPVATLSSPNTLGEVLNERFRLGRAPNLNENFTVGNRTYQLTPTGIFEVLDGVLAYPRDIEDIPYDGQQEFQQTGTTRTDGTTTVTPDDIEEVSSSMVPVGPVRRVQLPQENKRAAQSILVDSTNGQTLGQRPYNPDPNGPQDTEARTGPNVMLEPGDFILIPDSQELARVVASPQETYLEVWDGKKWNRAVYDPQAVRTLFDISKARRYKSKSESTAKGQLNRSPGGSPSQFTLGIAQTILRENGRNYYVGVPSKPKLAALTELNKQFERGKLPYEDYVAQAKDLLGLPKNLSKSKKARPVGIWENDITMPKANWRFMYNRQERTRPILVTADENALYMKAVGRGDIATAQEMVNIAAAKAGYNIKGARSGLYDDGVPLPPSMDANFGSGYYVAENATEESVAEFKQDLTRLYQSDAVKNAKALESRAEAVFVRSQNPLTVGDSEMSNELKSLINAHLEYQLTVNEAFAKATSTKEAGPGENPLATMGDVGRAVAARGRAEPNATPVEKSLWRLVRGDDGDFALAGANLGTPTGAVLSLMIEKGYISNDSLRAIAGRTLFSKTMTAEIVVQDPAQIKSAAPVTRRADGSVVPLSERFNPQSPRIFENRQDRQQESALDFGVANASRKTQADQAAQLIFQTPREGVVHRDDGTAFSYGKNGIYANVIAKKGVRPLMDAIKLVRQNEWKKVLHTGPISGPRALDFLRALMAANPDFTFYGSFNQKELESRIISGFLDNKAMSKTEQRNMRLAASQFYASQGLTEADVLNWLDSLPEDQRADAQFYFEHSPESGVVNFSRQKGRRYEVPSFSKRIIGGQGTVSATVKEIAAESTYPVAENNFIIQAVESRIASQKTLMAAHRDLASLRRKNLDQLDAVFDPQRTRAGIGLAALTYYTATVMKRFDSLVGDMHAGREPKDDLPLAQDIMFSLVKMMEYLNRTSGRAVNINRETFAYDPDTIINAIEIDLVKNSPARKRFITQAVAFKKKFGEIAPEWSDTQLKEAMQLEGINPIFLPAMRNFANNQGHLRDLEAEADALFVQAKISPFVSEAVRRNIKQIATIVQMSQSQWTKGFFAQMAHMAVEKERGTGLLDLASALPYNNTLTGIGVVTMNMVGSVMNYFSNLSSFALYWVGRDLIQGRGADALLKNAMAVTYGMLSPKWGLGSVPEGLTNVSQVALSGYRGDSVEAFTKAMGVTVNTATALYGRVGTSAAERNFVNMMKRAVTIMLIDAGRRAATAPDAFFKTVAENSFTGAMLYREAWDSWTLVRGTTNESRSDYIANYIEGRLGLKPMDQYRLDAQKVIDAHADVIMANSVSLLPREQELSSLRDLIAFNLRKEAREAALQGTPEGSQIVTDARNFAFSTSFSNQTKGAFRQIEDILEKMTDWGITPYLKGVDRTLAIQKGGPDRPSVDMRVRLGTSNPLQFMFLPFRGNLVRMLEEALNWTPLGAANRLITNQRYPDTYSQLEVYSSLVKGTIGMGLMGIAASALGMFDDEDEDKPVRRGVTGYKSLRTLGRNGQETIVPPYSAWAFNSEGDVVIGRFRDFPQLVATLGTMATWKEAYRDNPQNNFGGMMWQGGVSFAATTTDLGLYDAMSDMANRLKADPQADPSKQVMRFNEALAKNAKVYTLPLNRLQRDLLGLTRGYEVMPARGDFWATYVANTYAEGMLSEEQSNNLAKIVGPTGEVKSPQLLNRFMQTIEQPSEGLKWMLGNGYVLQKTDYTKPVSSAFPTTATKERAAVIFEEMNNGMFYVKHAPEIEKAAAKYYWPWISAYAADGERKAELQSFVDSPTNELRERQGSSQHKSLRELEQSDINSMVNKARQIASLEISAEYYTDNPRVKQWIAGIAAQEARKGPNLKDSREIRGLQGTSEGTPQPVGR